jgi:hypothetical protein
MEEFGPASVRIEETEASSTTEVEPSSSTIVTGCVRKIYMKENSILT